MRINFRDRTKIIYLVCFILGGITVYSLTTIFLKNSCNQSVVYGFREGNQGGLSNPLLFCDAPESNGLKNYNTLKESTDAQINRFLKDGLVSKASLYFRNLNTGDWIVVDPYEKYAPASMLKIALMIAYFKYNEIHPGILNKKIVYDGTINPAAVNTNAGTETALKVGKSYSMEDLIYRMVAYSDNDAKDLLHNNIEQSQEEETFTDLGLSRPSLNNNGDVMTVQEFSRFFRILYNATYLSKEDSDKALEILSKTNFNDGIVAELPKDITVAHKFGWRTLDSSDESSASNVTTELHDCGIVYNKSSPYLLCVMTKGKDVENLKGVIKNLSAFIYKYVQDNLR